jgi:hypothetical protein
MCVHLYLQEASKKKKKKKNGVCLWLTGLWLAGWLAGWLVGWLAGLLAGCHVHGSCIDCCTDVGIEVCDLFVFEFVWTGVLI